MPELTPRQIVAELNRHIVGQDAAKRAVAVAIRNRWRRQRLPEEMRPEVAPKNIMMIGPTGVGKTEIARRLAKLTGAPFIKVEATRYTEVGYYGRDVESMVRDLVENAIGLVREQERAKVQAQAQARVEQRLVDLLVPRSGALDPGGNGPDAERYQRTREKLRAMLAAGDLEDRQVEITVEQKAVPMMFTGVGLEQVDIDLHSMFEKILPKHTTRREMSVAEARKILFEEECDALINREKVHATAIDLAENLGIIFIDEMDKIVASEHPHGADVSRQGVQRDLLPIVEGTTVQTRYGYVKTDHILFIAAGAFHRAKPSDLMPELQGRFPIRVELNDLTKEDFVRILTEPKGALTKQYQALLATEGVELVFQDEAVDALATYAFQVNQTTQNIGARRLYTIMERLLEELSFEAPDMKMGRVVINAAYVQKRLQQIAQDEDLSKFIL
ncbi:MAG: ATP-dependent protease ATPase subunit HslU [Thermoguttaceae bacterium]